MRGTYDTRLMEWPCISSHSEGALLRVRATPKASRTEAMGLRGDRLSVRVQAPPVDGKANAALLKWVAKVFGLRAAQVRLVRGELAREKDLLLEGTTREAVCLRLDALTPETDDAHRAPRQTKRKTSRKVK